VLAFALGAVVAIPKGGDSHTHDETGPTHRDASASLRPT
jgi:hypothetical protein